MFDEVGVTSRVLLLEHRPQLLIVGVGRQLFIMNMREQVVILDKMSHAIH